MSPQAAWLRSNKRALSIAPTEPRKHRSADKNRMMQWRYSPFRPEAVWKRSNRGSGKMNTTEAAAFYLALAGMTLIATAWIWG